MTGAEILTGVLGTALSAVLIWGIKKGADYLSINEDSELMNVIEDYIEKGINKYEDKFTELIESKGKDISKENELVGAVISWLNENAPKIIKQFFGKNQEQIEEFVRNYVRFLIK